MPFGLPRWEELVDRLYSRLGQPRPKDTTAQDAVEYLRSRVLSDDLDRFKNTVHEVLYESYERDLVSLRKCETLAAIGAFVMGSRRGSVSEVLTFNFDDVLETYLEYHGFVTNPIHDPTDWVYPGDVSIYHPHGYLPQDRTKGDSADLVFDQRSYSRVLGDANNPFSQLALTLLRRRTCIFVGLSGADDNLDTLICRVQSDHPSRRESTPFWGVTFSDRDDDVARSKWENRGIFYRVVADYTRALPQLLSGICQCAALSARS